MECVNELKSKGTEDKGRIARGFLEYYSNASAAAFLSNSGGIVSSLPDPSNAPDTRLRREDERSATTFSRGAADNILMKAFSNVLYSQKDRDYRLLEVLVPELRGHFSNATNFQNGSILTLDAVYGAERTSDQLFKRAPKHLEHAQRYLTGSVTLKEVASSLFLARLDFADWKARLAVFPITFSALVLGAIIPRLRKDISNELKEVYKRGMKNLQTNPEICDEARKLLAEELHA